jgi:hypothetical protein
MADYNQVQRVYSGEYLDEMRERLAKRYRRRNRIRRARNIARDAAYYLGSFATATILAVAYLATIAILCGY